MNNQKTDTGKGSWVALLPLMTFIVVYLGISLALEDFYKVPITVAFLISSIVAIATLRGKTLIDRIKVFSRGASSENMMLMIWIFILAGAFASSAKAIGSIDSTVNLALTLLPAQMLMSGIFLAACFISMAVGTSVGTIVALTPIATGLATSMSASVPLLVGVVVGGAFFGDNLSFISDTTVVATQTQHCRMSDKFRANIRIVAPAAIAIFVLYMFIGEELHAPSDIPPIDFWKVIPYLVVLVTAICGINVLIVLALGVVLTGVVAITSGTLDIFAWMQSLNDGVLGMSELIIVTMLAGGMLEVVRVNGGIDAIISVITRNVKGSRGAELAIASLVVITDICTANNTVAIITVGPIAHQIAERFNIQPRRAASILDTFSCFAQSIIPYGAQLLMAAGLAAISPAQIVPYLFYPFALGAVALGAILFRKKS